MATDLPTPTPLNLPPYGFMNDEWNWDLLTRRVPVGLVLDGQPAGPQAWSGWLSEMADQLAQVLWPRFDPATSTWQGPAQAWALALTRADLQLMAGLRAELTRAVQACGKPLKLTHLKMFELEDEPRPGDPRYPTLDHYLPDLEAAAMEGLKGAIKAHLLALGPAPLRLKALMQRPRAYQVACMLGDTAFRYQHARSAVSPSMVSGHAMQGLLGRCAGYLAARRDLERGAGMVEALERYAIDVGDRRVYAGVHYPSDNLGSWLVSLQLAGPLFGNAGDEAHAFLVRSIRASLVLKAMRQHAETAESPYRLGLALLDRWMAQPPGPVLP